MITQNWITRAAGLLFLVFLLSGCATSYTLWNADEGVVINGSHCGQLPRLMSGTAYNICTMYGVPGDLQGANTESMLIWLAMDSTLSLVADIIVSPVTLHAQLNKPPIPVR